MIEIELTDDHKALVQTVREFAQKEVAPYIKEWDEKQEIHPEVLKKMGELNLLGVCIPEEYGGAGFDYISLGLVCEELEAQRSERCSCLMKWRTFPHQPEAHPTQR